MNEPHKWKRFLLCALKGCVVSIVAGAVLLLVLATLIQRGTIPSDMMETWVTVAVILSTFLGGMVSVRLQGRTAAITALLSGALLLLLLTIAAVAANGLRFANGCYVKLLISIFAGSLTGGMLGTRKKTAKKRKKTTV